MNHEHILFGKGQDGIGNIGRNGGLLPLETAHQHFGIHLETASFSTSSMGNSYWISLGNKFPKKDSHARAFAIGTQR